MLSNHPPHDENPNINYIYHGLKHFDESYMDVFQIADNPKVMFKIFAEMFPKIAQELYTVPVVKDLYARRHEFDVVIIDQFFNEVRIQRP